MEDRLVEVLRGGVEVIAQDVSFSFSLHLSSCVGPPSASELMKGATLCFQYVATRMGVKPSIGTRIASSVRAQSPAVAVDPVVSEDATVKEEVTLD